MAHPIHLTINCRTLGNQLKGVTKPYGIRFHIYRSVLSKMLLYEERLKHHGHADRIIYQHPADFLGKRHGGVGQFWSIEDSPYLRAMKEVAEQFLVPDGTVAIKEEGGKHSAATGWLTHTALHIHEDLAPWRAVFGPRTTVIADGLGSTKNYVNLTKNKWAGLNHAPKLAPDILPHVDGRFDDTHPAEQLYVNVQQLQLRMRDPEFAPSLEKVERDITLWIRNEEDIEWGLEQCERFGMVPSAIGNLDMHRRVAEWRAKG